MRPRVSALLAVLSMLLALTACGERATPTPTAAATEQKQIATPTEPMPTPTVPVEPEQQPAATTEPAPEPTTVEGQIITAKAMVENIEILLLESFPIQVNVVAQGNLPDGCTEIAEITEEQEGNAFEITITTSRPADKMCTQMLVPFEEVISLDVVGLPAGVYAVNVNGVSDTFEFTVDNAMIEPARSGRQHVPTFEEGPCPFAVPEGAAVECGFVIVPEDHDNPDGPTFHLAVAVLRDHSDEHQPDPVMVLSGGPGEKIMSNTPAMAQILAPVYPYRDLIVFDQRGVGLSEPALECPEWEKMNFDLLDEADPDVALRISFEAIVACCDRLVSEGQNLSVYNTAQNAADVNAIRIALGYDQVNLYGGSYGSLLAQATMRDHPEVIRSVVMNSVVPLEGSIFVDTSTTVPDTFLRLVDACTEDDACSSAYPDLQDVLFEVIDRLNAEPVPITVTNPLDSQSYAALLTGDAVRGNLSVALYTTQLLPAVPQAIYDVYNGDYGLMTQLSSARLALLGALSRGMTFSVVCTEDLIGRSPEELLERRAAFPEQLVGHVDPEAIIDYGIFGICENWPVEEGEPWIKEPLVSDIPTLLMAGELDHVAPPQFGRQVAENLSNSTFFEFPGVGHNVIVASECARSIAGDFVEDPTRAPDAACVAEMRGVVFDVPGEAEELVLEPFSDVERGFSGLVPAGWQELQPANLARGSSALDPAYFVLEAQPGTAAKLFANLAGQLGLDPEPEPIAHAEMGNFTWDFYTFERRGSPVDLALAEDSQKAYFVFLMSPPDEHEALYEQLFQPAVEAMASLE
jgi:pimeloyl-ACP methyl ester carboxylesterase